MLIVDVLIEHGTFSLNRPFSYAYLNDKKLTRGMRVLVPFNNRVIVGFIVDIRNTNLTIEEFKIKNGYDIKEINSILDDDSLLNEELLKLAEEISDYYISPLIKVYQTMLPPSLKPTSGSLKKAKIAYENYLVANEFDVQKLTAKQYEIYRLILNASEVKKSEVKSPNIVKRLLDIGALKTIKKEKYRYNFTEDEIKKDIILTKQQQSVIDEFCNSKDRVYLLEGVTGSGKTEVYIELTKRVLQENKQAIILVPEIALTPIMMHRFFSCFPNRVAILHSELSDGEKYDEYRKIRNHEVDIVVGTRSAIFAPLDNIGLIIIDEEHVDSYKQENVPSYHAREVAIMRINHFDDAKVLLGSATPTLESRARAKKGRYHYLKMSERVNNLELPRVQIIDMNDHRNIDYDSSMFSLTLRKKIAERLNKKEQVVLLLNRRGYSTSVVCQECQKIIKCPNCNVPLTYHSDTKTLKCHHCGHSDFMSNICPNCGSSHLLKIGFGIEKVYEECKRLFPSSKVLRLDSDIGQVKSNIHRILQDFRDKKADILIGTQMIAKGHDFSNVTLVGIVLADLGLSIPSYRASERTFELLTQAIGRAGRADKEGEAIIQSYMPNHYSIKLAALQNYSLFYGDEMAVRKIQQYPPYTYISTMIISGEDEQEVEDVADEMALELFSRLKGIASIIGPSIPYYKSTRIFKREIMIKYKNYGDVKDIFREYVELFAKRSKINLVIDVDSL